MMVQSIRGTLQICKKIEKNWEKLKLTLKTILYFPAPRRHQQGQMIVLLTNVHNIRLKRLIYAAPKWVFRNFEFMDYKLLVNYVDATLVLTVVYNPRI